MVDYHRYKQAMDEAHATVEKAAGILKREDLSPKERQRVSYELTRKAAQLRKLAMTFASEVRVDGHEVRSI